MEVYDAPHGLCDNTTLSSASRLGGVLQQDTAGQEDDPQQDRKVLTPGVLPSTT